MRVCCGVAVHGDECRSLGLLNYIRVWHDNSGNGASASWFLKYIIVRDLQTMQKQEFTLLLNILYYDQAAEAKDQATAGGLAVTFNEADAPFCLAKTPAQCKNVIVEDRLEELETMRNETPPQVLLENNLCEARKQRKMCCRLRRLV